MTTHHLRRTSRTARAAALTVLGVAAAGVTVAVPAHALEPGALTFAGPTTATVGVPAVMTATGHVPSGTFLERYVYVYSIPTSVVTTCPATHTGALQLSGASSGQGGDTVAFVNVAGDFSVPIAYTATQAGTFLLCAYLSEMSIVDAAAQHVVTASGATGGRGGTGGTGGTGGAGGGSTTPGATAPLNTGRPKVVQRGNRMVCKRGTWSGAASYSYGGVPTARPCAARPEPGSRSPRPCAARG